MADNMVTLVGAIGTEPELKTTSGGSDVLNFTLATTERLRTDDGKWIDGATSWFRVAVWNQLGRNAHASLHKGQRVVVHGSLRIAEFRTDSGTGRRAEVKAFAIGHDLAFGTSSYTRGGTVVPPVVQNPVQTPAQPVQQTWPTQQPVAEPAQAAWSRPMEEAVDAPF